MTSRIAVLVSALALAACGGAKPEAFTLRFQALVDGAPKGCTDELTGFGAGSDQKVGINDLRFYVSNLKFTDRAGNTVAATLDKNDFQYDSAEGQVSLIDLTGNTEGTCGMSMLGGGEGTARTNDSIKGTTLLGEVAGVSFDVGVPQPVMKKVIADNTAEGAPSPMREMYWSWNSGYRHLVFNFTVRTPTNAPGEGYLHVGSRNCNAMGMKALADRDRCEFVNTPKVALTGFDLTKDQVGLDLRKLLANIDFVSPLYDANFVVIGMGPGVECHSGPTQPDCAPLFTSLGLDMGTGGATAAGNTAFVKSP
ncbi:MAG: metallo-mystery pair system four-Cys motif protein [Myxococcaceae bacterium]|nr:metallo-mystery pair system four-Cys motif protein [Myxococcaceae bacterium]